MVHELENKSSAVIFQISTHIKKMCGLKYLSDTFLYNYCFLKLCQETSFLESNSNNKLVYLNKMLSLPL